MDIRASRADNPQAVRVLVVAADSAKRGRIGEWLSQEGHDVIECPGPRPFDYVCLGGRGKECPLARAAEVVVLDLDLASDAALMGTPSWQLLDYYLGRGRPVVAISSPDQSNRTFLDERVVCLDPYANREEILAAVDRLTTTRSSVSEIGTFRWTPPRGAHRPYWKIGLATNISSGKVRREREGTR